MYGMKLKKSDSSVELKTFSEHCVANLEYAIFEEGFSKRSNCKHVSEALDGLWYLHQNGIAHRKIRLEAILVSWYNQYLPRSV